MFSAHKKCVSNESSRQIEPHQLRQPQKNGNKNYRTRKAEKSPIPNELIRSLSGTKAPLLSIFRTLKYSPITKNILIQGISCLTYNRERESMPPWNRSLIPSHLSALKNEDKRISANERSTNGQMGNSLPPLPLPLLLPEEPT